MRIRAYSILSIVLLMCFKEGQSQRTKNFPKVVEYVDKMPDQSKLWIFIMAGQSNMAGRGLVEPQDTIPNKKILTIDKAGKWIYAKEPLHFYEPTLTGLDSGMSFARRLLDDVPSEVSIAMIPCAVGNTSIEQWLNNDTYRGVTLLSNFKENVQLTEKYGEIKGVLWHQGEADAKENLIPLYGSNLKKLTAKLRAIVGRKNLPIFIAQLGSFAEPIEWQQQWDSINTIIKQFVMNTDNTYLINTQDLRQKGDHIHFDSESQREMGKRYAIKFLETEDKQIQSNHH